jgi:hypothetical protein
MSDIGSKSTSDSTERAIWGALDALRGRHRDPSEVVSTLQEQGINVEWRILARLSGRLEWESVPSEPLVDFMLATLSDAHGCRVFDPWANIGVLLSAVTEKIAPSSALGLIYQSAFLTIAECLAPTAVWRVGDLIDQLRVLQNDGQEFDVVVCAPPWGLKMAPNTRDVSDDKRLAKLTMDHRIIFESCKLLAGSGRALCFLPNQFLLASQANGVRTLLAEQGLHLWSVIALPQSWKPLASISGNLIEIRRGSPETIFVGRAAPESKNESCLRTSRIVGRDASPTSAH